ncbi:MAG: GNAT family N-acetyltransferase [Cyanobacteria bacterium P01_B01_bin.77]
MNIEFRELGTVEISDLVELMNNPLVRRHMPLSNDNFGVRECETFLSKKKALWTEYGYGPWAFFIDDKFAGWGGLQPEDGYPDLALALHPNYWGVGNILYKKIVQRAFGEMKLKAISALLPVTRKSANSLLILGFRQHGTVTLENKQFNRYLLEKPAYSRNSKN